MYALDVDEIEAKYARKDGDPIDAKLDVIIEAAFKRKKFCVNTVLSDLDEDESDDDDSDADDQEPPSKKAKKKKSSSHSSRSSDGSVPDDEKKMPAAKAKDIDDWQGGSEKSSTESSSWHGTSDDNKAFKQRQHKRLLRKKRSKKPSLPSVPESPASIRTRSAITPAWQETVHHIFSDQDFINYACVQDSARAIFVDPFSL